MSDVGHPIVANVARRAAVPPPRQFGPGTEHAWVRVSLLVITLIGRDLTSNFDGFQMTVQIP